MIVNYVNFIEITHFRLCLMLTKYFFSSTVIINIPQSKYWYCVLTHFFLRILNRISDLLFYEGNHLTAQYLLILQRPRREAATAAAATTAVTFALSHWKVLVTFNRPSSATKAITQ